MISESALFPVCLNVTGMRALVVGMGTVGRRRVEALCAAGARVRVVDPGISAAPTGFETANVDWIGESYREGHLEDVRLAFAAATPPVNLQVIADAKARGIWVNSATDPALADFHLPAVLRQGQVQIAISTGGAAPGLSRQIRARLEEEFDDVFAEWVGLLAELRPIVLNSVPDRQLRREIFEKLSDWIWLDRLRAEGPEAIRQAMRGMVDESAHR
jgi:siroheme synthase-like protein